MTRSNFDLKEEVRAYWSARATTFDHSPAHQIEDRVGMPQWQKLIQTAAGLDTAETMEGLNVLDLACGTGEISRVLCSLGATVTGLDFSEDMLAQARSKLEDARWTPLLCDAEELRSIADGSVDFAITRHLAWTLTNPQAAFAEWHRVLKPGGRLLINDGNWQQGLSLRYSLKRKLAHWLQPEVARSEAEVAADRSIWSQLPFKDGLSSESLTDMLQSAGFTLVQRLDPSPLYAQGMKAWPLAVRLRQSSENRFSLVFVK